MFIPIFHAMHFSTECFPTSGFGWRFRGGRGADSPPPGRAGAAQVPPRRRPTTRRGATTLRVMMWSRGVVFEVVCATEPCSGLVVFHKDCLRTVKLRTCVHQGGVVFEIVGATEPCSGRVIFTRIGCEQSNGGLVSISGRR